VTTVYVTHDQVEAMTMGDRVAVLKDGVLLQVDTPLNLYDKPRSAFVAGFIGSPAMNLLTVPVTDEGVGLGNDVVPLSRETRGKLEGEREAILGVRPESFKVVPEDDRGIAVTVDIIEELGADAFVYASLEDEGGEVDRGGAERGEDGRVEIIARHDARQPPARGSRIRLAVEPENIHLFSASTGERVLG
ncbi:MAG TPA: sn-glycerol-3-phosphate ABC transporter ATP-binding protein, partial [Nocardioidaceae bacterium]|nr:sn-glycerol-3-phosphate ABC transporter ATP-binding protein [Nocardioidaceae bacterium]